MTVFKGYMRIMKKNTGLILLYLGIFFGVTMALQAAAGKETYTSYESEKISEWWIKTTDHLQKDW